MGVLVMISTFGAANGIILVGPRVYYSMAQDGLLFKWLGGVHPVFGTPHRAILLQAIWASVLAWTNTYGALFSRVIYTEWIFFALMAAGLMRLRRRADYRPTLRMWAYPAVPLIFIAASVLIVINQGLSMPGDSLLGLGLVAAGWPIYLIWSRRPRPS
jgi:APA family basic amino acid/polyamine antiporter